MMLPLGKSRKSRIMEAGGPEISAGTEVADVPGAAYRQTHYKGR